MKKIHNNGKLLLAKINRIFTYKFKKTNEKKTKELIHCILINYITSFLQTSNTNINVQQHGKICSGIIESSKIMRDYLQKVSNSNNSGKII
jgi:hypothetical protein